MDIEFDTSDLDKSIDECYSEVKSAMGEVGEIAVKYAVERGNYQNRTGTLRKSNRFNVVDDGLELINDAPYASYVEKKGFEVLSGGALEAEKLLKERFE